MRAALFLAALVAPGMAAAQTTGVQAGDHPTFTRLVIDLPQRGDWQLGRTPGGYELRVAGDRPRYDLSRVFNVITRNRLASIWTDPQTGNLRIDVACVCHAEPFEFRSDMIVIDLRDGPPQAGSAFELSLDGTAQPVLTAQVVPGLRPRPAPNRPAPPPQPPEATLLAAVRPASRPATEPLAPDPGTIAPAPTVPTAAFPPLPAQPASATGPAVPLDLTQATPSPQVDAMRGDLLRELGRAATAGVIDVDKPRFPTPAPDAEQMPGEKPFAHVTIEGLPGLDALVVNDEAASLTARGDLCLPADQFDLAAWGDNRPYDAQMADAREALVGEFDRPDPGAIATLARLHLYFGFGAEARNVLTGFGYDAPEAKLWIAMAHVLDDQAAPPDGVLTGQIGCDGPVAMWATLAEPVLSPTDPPNAPSVAAAFSALPLHLRRHLGAPLAEKMLSVGDITTAQAIRNAIWRAPGEGGPGAQMIDAQLDLSRGNVAAAADKLSDLHRQGGPAASRALIDLVDARLALGETVEQGTLLELAALRREHQGSALEPGLLRAEMLALGAAGNYDAAFERAMGAHPETVADLWAQLAERGQDAPLLTHAVLSPDAPLPPVEPKVRRKIADRLLTLGFADQALRWLPMENDMQTVVNVARAELLRGDARTALRGLAGLDGPEIDQLRAQALARLGDQDAAARAFDDAGDAAARAASLWRAQDWVASADMGAEPVRTALRVLAPDAPLPLADGSAPLAQGRALLDDSAKARDAILSLFAATPDPATVQP